MALLTGTDAYLNGYPYNQRDRHAAAHPHRHTHTHTDTYIHTHIHTQTNSHSQTDARKNIQTYTHFTCWKASPCRQKMCGLAGLSWGHPGSNPFSTLPPVPAATTRPHKTHDTVSVFIDASAGLPLGPREFIKTDFNARLRLSTVVELFEETKALKGGLCGNIASSVNSEPVG